MPLSSSSTLQIPSLPKNFANSVNEGHFVAFLEKTISGKFLGGKGARRDLGAGFMFRPLKVGVEDIE
jgi:hypothetical protein